MKKGFTLIELLVAMAIIGILSSIALGNFQTTQLKARDARRKADLKHITNALEAYHNDKNQYPLDDGNGILKGCGEDAEQDCAWDGEFSNSTTTTIYMIKLPSDPKVYSYYYDASATGSSYQLYARLENTLDQAVPKDADDNPQVYTNTTCSTADPTGCNYGISSTNIRPETNHALADE